MGTSWQWEPEHETWVIYPGDKATTRRIVQTHADSFRNGWIGRQLPVLFLDAGLVEVVPVPEMWLVTELELVRQFWLDVHLEKVKQTGILPAHQVDAWLADLVEAQQRGRFLFGLAGFIVVGRKPTAALEGTDG